MATSFFHAGYAIAQLKRVVKVDNVEVADFCDLQGLARILNFTHAANEIPENSELFSVWTVCSGPDWATYHVAWAKPGNLLLFVIKTRTQ